MSAVAAGVFAFLALAFWFVVIIGGGAVATHRALDVWGRRQMNRWEDVYRAGGYAAAGEVIARSLDGSSASPAEAALALQVEITDRQWPTTGGAA